MEAELKINVKEIIERDTNMDNHKDLIKWMLFSNLSEMECNEIIIELLTDMKESEEEFDKREHIINAYTVLINGLS